jgi:hypothetical protein
MAGLLARSSGATLANMNERSLLDVRCPAVDADRQARTVAAIELSDSRSSQKLDVLRKLRSRLTEYRNALITEAVTGELDVTRLSDAQLDESAHAVLEDETPEVLAS